MGHRQGKFFIFMILLFFPLLSFSQIQYVDELISKIVFTDSSHIKLFCQVYSFKHDVERIEILDFDNTGPNEGDIIRIFPGREIFILNKWSPELRELMQTVVPGPNICTIGITKFILEGRPTNPDKEILHAIAKLVSKNYPDSLGLMIHYEQFKDGTFRFLMRKEKQ